MTRYILQDKTPTAELNLELWAKWYETGDRRVALTRIGNYRVSTVFLALDHSFGETLPQLFETMIFKGEDYLELWAERCSTWDEAEKMHERGCEYVQKNLTL